MHLFLLQYTPTTGGLHKFTCQHGDKECQGNMIQVWLKLLSSDTVLPEFFAYLLIAITFSYIR